MKKWVWLSVVILSTAAVALVFLFLSGRKHTIQSQVLEEKRPLLVHLPPGYRESTLTYPVLNHARHIIIMAQGKGKAPVMKHIAEEGEPLLPIQRIQPVAGTITWLLDREAASLISGGVFHESG